MKALLYKDLCVLWKQMKFVIFLVALFCAMPSVGGLDLNTFFMAYAGLLVPISLFSYDERARWDALAAMLPYAARDLVLSRYLFSWLATAFAVLCYLVGQVLFSPGTPLTGEALLLPAFTVGLLLVIQAVYFPVLFRLGAEKGRLAMLVVIVAVVCLAALVSALLEEISPAPVRVLVPALLVVGTLLSLASVKVAEKQYARRAW